MPYFTTEEFRALMPDMDDEAKFPDARVEIFRDGIESLIEEACETSFIPRAASETASVADAETVLLSTPYVRSLTSVSVNGADSTASYSLSGGVLRRNIAADYPRPWPPYPPCRLSVAVEYMAGYSDECPADLKLAAMQAVRDKLLALRDGSGKPSERATSTTNDFGNVQYAVASEDHPTGLPEVDATIMRWARHVRVPGIA